MNDYNKQILIDVKNKLSSICIQHIDLVYLHTKNEFKELHQIISEFINNINSFSINFFNTFKINIIAKINNIISIYNSLINEYNYSSLSNFSPVNTSNVILEHFNLINELSSLNAKIAGIVHNNANDLLFISSVNPNFNNLHNLHNFSNFNPNENINNMIDLSNLPNFYNTHNLGNFNQNEFTLNINNLNYQDSSKLYNVSINSNLNSSDSYENFAKIPTWIDEEDKPIKSSVYIEDFKKIKITKIHKKNSSFGSIKSDISDESNNLNSTNSTNSSNSREEINFRFEQRKKIKTFGANFNSIKINIKSNNLDKNIQKEISIPKNNLDRQIKINFKKSLIII